MFATFLNVDKINLHFELLINGFILEFWALSRLLNVLKLSMRPSPDIRHNTDVNVRSNAMT